MKERGNIPYRNKNIRGAKVDDLYLYLKKMKEHDENNSVCIEEIQRFIEFHFKYEPNN